MGCIFTEGPLSAKKAAKATPAFLGSHAIDDDTTYEFQSGNEYSAKGKINPVLMDPALSPLRRPGSRILFNLFSDRQLLAVVDEFEESRPGHFVTRGHVDGDTDAVFHLTYYEGRLFGTIYAGADGNFRLTQVDEETYRAARINSFDPPVIHVDSLDRLSGHTFERDRLIKAAALAQPNRTRYIDIAVYYDSSAMTGAGSKNAMKAEIVAMIDEMNAALKNSKLKVVYNLVDTQLIAYKSTSNSLGDELGYMSDLDDSVMDDIAYKRDSVGADLVGLIINSATDACGIAYLKNALNSSNTYAFCAAQRSCITPGMLTFAHEVGHLMGCHHDYDAANGAPGLYAYSHGYVFTGSDGVGYKTILAYGSNTRIPYFSSPSRKYKNKAIGNASRANNALTINNSADYVEQYNTKSSAIPTVTSPTAGQTITTSKFTATLTVTKESMVDSLAVYDIYNGTAKLIKVLRKPPWKVVVSKLTNGSHKLFARLIDKGRNSTVSDTVSYTMNYTASDGWDTESIGEEQGKGSQSMSGDSVILTSASQGMPASDQVEFRSLTLPLNFKMRATLNSLSAHSGMAQAGIMVRDSSDGVSPMFFFSLGWDDQLRLESRSREGTAKTTKVARGTFPGVRNLMLVRRGTTLAAYQGDGLAWTYVGKVIGSKALTVVGGLALTSNDATQSDTAIFSQVILDSVANYPPTLAVTGLTAQGFYAPGDPLTLVASVTDLDGNATLKGVRVTAVRAQGDTLVASDPLAPFNLPCTVPEGTEGFRIQAFDALDTVEVYYPIRLK
jgi:Metallo-peptidase family M12B Reprolysin-like